MALGKANYESPSDMFMKQLEEAVLNDEMAPEGLKTTMRVFKSARQLKQAIDDMIFTARFEIDNKETLRNVAEYLDMLEHDVKRYIKDIKD